MPVLNPVLQPTLSGQDNGVQPIGMEGRDKGDVGAPAVEPTYADGPLLASPAPNATPAIYSGIDYLDSEMHGVPVDHTPFPYSQGDPDRGSPWDGDVAQAGDYDQGAPAANRFYGNPDIGKPVLQQYMVPTTDRQPVYDPIGYMVETPSPDGPRPVTNRFNDARINEGIGYYIQEDERPLYHQLATVPAAYEGPGGLYQPDNRYSDTVYNDAGIPDAFITPPDAPVRSVPAQAYVTTDDYYGAY